MGAGPDANDETACEIKGEKKKRKRNAKRFQKTNARSKQQQHHHQVKSERSRRSAAPRLRRRATTTTAAGDFLIRPAGLAQASQRGHPSQSIRAVGAALAALGHARLGVAAAGGDGVEVVVLERLLVLGAAQELGHGVLVCGVSGFDDRRFVDGLRRVS